MPEILKKLNNIDWVNVRKLELDKNAVSEDSKVKTDDVIGGMNLNFVRDVYLLIKNLDDGNGVSVDEIIKSSNNSNAESIINKLLEIGDIFEIKPGKLKVLE